MEKEIEKKNESSRFYLALTVSVVVAILAGITFGYMLGKDAGQNDSSSLRLRNQENKLLIQKIDSLSMTYKIIELEENEAKSIDGDFLIILKYSFDSSADLEFEGCDSISIGGDYFSSYFPSSIRFGDRIFVKSNNRLWVLNVLSVKPVVKLEVKQMN